ncbi:MAG: hypothetical protein P9M15_01670, partial [Candidatus Electryoneaceae bacterium]|nr:hypothetical protein [Candidatus Electryoneaceae bacterium]
MIVPSRQIGLWLLAFIILVGWSHPWGQSDAPWGRSSDCNRTPADIAGCVAYYPLGLACSDTVANTTQDLSGYGNTGAAPNPLGAAPVLPYPD